MLFVGSLPVAHQSTVWSGRDEVGGLTGGGGGGEGGCPVPIAVNRVNRLF